jgi:cyclopropane fatty-acyl-phospholipid synthase-like methyltransferase
MGHWRAAKARLAVVKPALWFRGSGRYWESRYLAGGTSGAGSYGAQAEYKASFLNAFVKDNDVRTVVEFGCGDGNQLRLAAYPSYLGLDVSRTAVGMCIEAFQQDESKSFLYYEPSAFSDPARFVHGDLVLSLDVVYHLIEDEVYDAYMRGLFAAADRFVIVYATDTERRVAAPHVRHRAFTEWVATHATQWRIAHVEPAPLAAYQTFYVFAREEA